MYEPDDPRIDDFQMLNFPDPFSQLQLVVESLFFWNAIVSYRTLNWIYESK